MGAALALGTPFTVLYDFEHSKVPPLLLGRKLLGFCTTWADANARAWDEQVQGLAIVISNTLLRTFIDMCRRILAPPQPMAMCATRDEALEFLCDVRTAKSHVKASYA